jgi:PAS domain S-box-containing protein
MRPEPGKAGARNKSTAGGGEITKQERKGAGTMARQSSNGHGVRPGRDTSTGAAVLERPEHERPTTKNGNGAGHGAVDQELFADYAGQVAAIRKSQAVIEFSMDGTVLDANDNFLKALGYRLEEIQGQHHSMFVEPAYKLSSEYREFWAALNRGEYQAAEYKRIGKGGKEVWIQASYNPILDPDGKPFKVVKFATDMTEQKLRNADYIGQIAAISKSQAVVEFKMDGTVLTANDNFLKALGYTLDEIKGRHHSMFVDEAFRQSYEYKEFWAALNRGEYQAAEYKRLGKGGKEVWIQASYNPIMDLNGKPFKVVKYADQGGRRRQAGYARRRQQAPGRLPQSRRGRERHAGRGHRPPERLGRVRGPDLQGRHPAEDHRQLQRRLQRDQEQPQRLHRRVERVGHRRPIRWPRPRRKASWQTRADATSLHLGRLVRKVIEGFNLTLDNVIKPLNVSAEYVDRISKGDIPPKITDSYNGDFNEIKNNLNVCIDAMSLLVADAVLRCPRLLSRASLPPEPTPASTRATSAKSFRA